MEQMSAAKSHIAVQHRACVACACVCVQVMEIDVLTININKSSTMLFPTSSGCLPPQANSLARALFNLPTDSYGQLLTQLQLRTVDQLCADFSLLGSLGESTSRRNTKGRVAQHGTAPHIMATHDEAWPHTNPLTHPPSTAPYHTQHSCCTALQPTRPSPHTHAAGATDHMTDRTTDRMPHARPHNHPHNHTHDHAHDHPSTQQPKHAPLTPPA
mmetsp:Transcript_71505/g.118845  ORF Transcript_71505/g.118845 Transcript_71505/m.118845 type:complete len:214 (+) Transcript_71505:97-738(+)